MSPLELLTAIDRHARYLDDHATAGITDGLPMSNRNVAGRVAQMLSYAEQFADHAGIAGRPLAESVMAMMPGPQAITRGNHLSPELLRIQVQKVRQIVDTLCAMIEDAEIRAMERDTRHDGR